MRKVFSSLGASAMALASSALPVFGASPTPAIKLQKGGDIKTNPLFNLEELTIAGLVSGLIRIAVIAAAVIFFFWLILGGIRWILSGGDKTKTEEARAQITAALIGLVIVFSAWAITQLLRTLFGFDLFNLSIAQIGN